MTREWPLRLGVLVSGQGTNLQAIVDAIARRELDAEIAVVVCNHTDAPAVGRAKAAGIRTQVYELRDFASKLEKQQKIAKLLKEAQVDLVVCAGWDRVLKPEFVRQFEGRIINVHPSLLPAFGGGLHAIEDAYRYGVKVTGCTVHFVTEQVDSGPVISQAAVEVAPDDTVDSLAQKIHREEHRLLVDAIRLYAQGRLKVNERKVEVC